MEHASKDRALTCSVVIPVRNDAAYLRRFLTALSRQSVSVDDVIVVDNGSTDDSAAVAHAWGARVIPVETVGIPFAAASGYDAATGAVIVRADADTVPGNNWIRDLLHRFDTDEAIVAVSGPGHFYGMHRGLRAAASAIYFGGYFWATALALGHAPLFGTNLAFRRAWWVEVRSGVHLSNEVHDDMDLSFRVRPGDRVVFDSGIVVGMSARPLSANGTVRVKRAFETLRVNWAREYPWFRWFRRIRHNRRIRRS